MRIREGFAVVNLEGGDCPAWDNLPESFWPQFLGVLIELGIDRFGFFGTSHATEIARFTCFQGLHVESLGEAGYGAYHGKKGIHRLPVWKLDQSIVERLNQTCLQSWCAGNDGFDTDELVFFRGGQRVVSVIPYEHIVIFEDFSDRDVALFQRKIACMKNSLFFR